MVSVWQSFAQKKNRIVRRGQTWEQVILREQEAEGEDEHTKQG